MESRIVAVQDRRSAALNRLTVSAEADALAARLYHGSNGPGCLASAAMPLKLAFVAVVRERRS